jgi:hypothetical protein
MKAVSAYYDGQAFVPVVPVKARRNQKAIVTLLDEVVQSRGKKTLLDFAGAFSEDTYREYADALKDTERVDVDEW